MKAGVRVLDSVLRGDVVIKRDVNRKGFWRVRVATIGRLNLTVEGDKTPFSIETGYAKDNYAHAWLTTVATFEHEQLVEAARAKLADFGVEFKRGVTDERVLAVADALKPLTG